jgi:hypothetical protein
LLTWATTQETNSDRFEIERSANGKNWAHIGTVASSGESKVQVDYSYADKDPLVGENLYRLKMIDKDNSQAYSAIRSVKISKGDRSVPYPNPVSDKLLIENFGKVHEVSVKNTAGHYILRKQTVSNDGIDVSQLKPGFYIVTLTLFDGTISTHKVAVAR